MRNHKKCRFLVRSYLKSSGGVRAAIRGGSGGRGRATGDRRAYRERLSGRAYRERPSGRAYRERPSGRAYRVDYLVQMVEHLSDYSGPVLAKKKTDISYQIPEVPTNLPSSVSWF